MPSTISLFRPYRVHCTDAAYCRRCSYDVWLFVCPSVTTVNPAKTANININNNNNKHIYIARHKVVTSEALINMLFREGARMTWIQGNMHQMRGAHWHHLAKIRLIISAAFAVRAIATVNVATSFIYLLTTFLSFMYSILYCLHFSYFR